MRLRVVIVVALVSVLTTAGCGARGGGGGRGPAAPPGTETAGCANVRAPEPVVTAGATMYPTDEALGDVLERVRARGEGQFADVFAGLEVVPEQGYAIVYRVPSGDFDAAVRDIAGPTCVKIRDAAHSGRDLLALRDRVQADDAYWKQQGIRINMIAPLHTGAGVEVGVDASVLEKARTELPKRYGTTPPVLVVEGGAVVPAIAPATG